MMSEAPDLLLAVGRELRLRRFMGPLPFDVDQWTRQAPECDLPRLEDADSGYHFEVRNVHTLGTFFKLRIGRDGKPCLTVGSLTGPRPYPADLDGWRAVVAEFNQVADKSVLSPRTYIWLHGHRDPVRQAHAEDQARLEEAMGRLGWPSSTAPFAGPAE
ncbi:hypothetical protein ACQEVC_21835 [Plantactinospora sp. CA-294935]|uniref:hypothetical protein n=1 Tax=Plantactinospora sp. CA-294935 TaxID=3240012 RepID=UPI003D9189B2